MLISMFYKVNLNGSVIRISCNISKFADMVDLFIRRKEVSFMGLEKSVIMTLLCHSYQISSFGNCSMIHPTH